MSAPAPPDDPHYRLLGDDDVLQPGDQETLPNRRPAGARLAWAWRETVMTGRRVGEVREWASHYRRPLPETAYRALDGDEVEARGFDDSYAVLAGPGGFECVLTEPEDRDWHRDGKAVVAELNRLRATVAELTAVCERTDAFMTRLMKAVPWGQTFDLDIAGLNTTLLALPRAVAAGKQALGESS